MTPKQQRFAAEYTVDLNGAQAAIRAGYSPRTANRAAAHLLTVPDVIAAVATGKAAQLEAAGLSAARVLEELRRIAFVDLRGFFDVVGNLKPLAALTADQGAVLASFEVIKKNATAGDGVTDTIHKFRVWDKIRALEALAKHFGLLVERVEVSGSVSIIETRLHAARARLAALRKATLQDGDGGNG